MSRSDRIAYAMITADRSPQPNYFAATMESLKRSGFFQPGRELSIFDAGRRSEDFTEDLFLSAGVIEAGGEQRLTADLNAARALRRCVQNGCEWVVMIEDDLLFVRDFAGAVECWLSVHSSSEYRIYALYCPYPQVREAAERGETAWRYPIEAFYGVQCYAIRSADALSVAEFIESDDTRERWRGREGQYDLMLHEWQAAEYPKLGYALASAPSLAQHVGLVTSVGAVFHESPSFDASYRYPKRSAAA